MSEVQSLVCEYDDTIDKLEDNLRKERSMLASEKKVPKTRLNSVSRSLNLVKCSINTNKTPEDEDVQAQNPNPKDDKNNEILKVTRNSKNTPKTKSHSLQEPTKKSKSSKRTTGNSTMKANEETESDSDESVVDDEDFEIQQMIREEKKKKNTKKKSTPKSSSKGTKSKRGKQSDSDSDIDKLLEESKKVLLGSLRPRKSSNVEASGSKRKRLSTPSSEREELSDKETNIEKTPTARNRGPTKDKKVKLTEESKKEDEDSAASGASGISDATEGSEKEELLRSRRKGVSMNETTSALIRRSKMLLSSDSEDEIKFAKKKKKSKNNSDSDDKSVSGGETKKQKKKVIVDDSDEDVEKEKTKRKGTNKKMLTKDQLAKETVDAEKAEKERRKRLEVKQKEFNGIQLVDGVDLATALKSSSNVPKLKSVVLDPDKESVKPEPVSVHPSIVRVLKHHQAEGVQFMYDCAFESISRLDQEGSGGILAHCMGLGKTLQVITFLHTVMNHPKIKQKVKRALVVVPKNVVINWFKEFKKWLEDNDPALATLQVLELDSFKDYTDRLFALRNWYKCDVPSIMIIGYDMFRILTHDDDDNKKKKVAKTKKNKRLAKLQKDFRTYLQDPGPDIIICDEAHKLKNDESALSKTMVKIKTKRRICLTGTPLQNNLMEYHCMVNFVKPGLLGTKAEFANRFANIITRGRVKDATPLEVKFMQRRCHVLFEHLKKCVDRKDYRVLMAAIPPKQEYVINVRLTDRQCRLYKAFLESIVNPEGTNGLSKRLLSDYYVLSRVWTHPHQLLVHEEKLERERILKDELEEEEEFINDDESEEEAVEESGEDSDVIALDDEDSKDTRKSRRLGGQSPENEGVRSVAEYSGWFAKSGLVSAEDKENFTLSNKLILLVSILKKCEEIGDKLLVFSQSLESLTLIKKMLEHLQTTDKWFADGHEAVKSEGETWGWTEGRDYMVIDGSVQSGKRDAVQCSFNDPGNLRARLMLISTKAGSLGTNMVAANRVIIFDACWNPSHDTQSLFRVYRFGQTKPVYIYRFIAQGTMEERIYKRQVTKESTSMRVVDEAQIQRHYEGNDLLELYRFDAEEIKEEDKDKIPNFAPPKDRLLADVLLNEKASVVNYFQHDTLFAHVEEEKLTEDELKEAWVEYEKDKLQAGRPIPLVGPNMLHMRALDLQKQSEYLMNITTHTLTQDPIFINCFVVLGMDNDTALKISYLKRVLEDLLPQIPDEMRGGIVEFNSFFLNFITQACEERHNANWLLNKAVATFRTVNPFWFQPTI
ncbi:unnamed protein product [Auanema sp. JU1783]|nr:unnamed protein product [Auanema sp. JU1783]